MPPAWPCKGKSFGSAVHLVLLLVRIVCALPLLWALSISFMGKQDLYRSTPTVLPSKIILDNYAWVVGTMTSGTSNRYPKWFLNSVIVTMLTVAIVTLAATMAAYAVGRLRFRGRDAIFYSTVLSIFIPRAGGLMALYEEMYFLHLRNSLIGLAFLFAGGMAVPVFIMRQAFLPVPSEFEDAAPIDGANRWQVFRSIMMPMATGAMAVIAIFTFIEVWGKYLVTITMIDFPNLYTMGVGIAGLFTGGAQVSVTEVTTSGAKAAGYLVFILSQKWFIRGLSEGIKF